MGPMMPKRLCYPRNARRRWIPGSAARHNQTLLTEVLSAMRERMPFALLGFDTDNDSVFMNETVKTYCEEAGRSAVVQSL